MTDFNLREDTEMSDLDDETDDEERRYDVADLIDAEMSTGENKTDEPADPREAEDDFDPPHEWE